MVEPKFPPICAKPPELIDARAASDRLLAWLEIARDPGILLNDQPVLSPRKNQPGPSAPMAKIVSPMKRSQRRRSTRPDAQLSKRRNLRAPSMQSSEPCGTGSLRGAPGDGQVMLAALDFLGLIARRQGPWNVDLRTPPGPEGSNGSLLRIRRGHPGIFHLRITILD